MKPIEHVEDTTVQIDRQPYTRPQLMEYGSLVKHTAGGTNNKTETKGGSMVG